LNKARMCTDASHTNKALSHEPTFETLIFHRLLLLFSQVARRAPPAALIPAYLALGRNLPMLAAEEAARYMQLAGYTASQMGAPKHRRGSVQVLTVGRLAALVGLCRGHLRPAA